MLDLPADRIALVLLEDRRVRGLLALEDDVEDGVQAVAARQDAPELALLHADRVGLLARARTGRRGSAPPCAGAATRGFPRSLALLDLETDSLAGHGGGV